MLRVHAVRAFSDNYIWVLADTDTHQSVIVDPGDASPVRAFLDQNAYHATAILATHHHPDHVGGIPKLASPEVQVIGPAQEKIPGKTHS